jgi:hypothetical protein
LHEGGFPQLEDVLNALKKDEATCTARCEKVKIYEFSPSEFISFARKDLEDGSEKGLLNAIANASRAISCRVDEILLLSWLQPFMTAERWQLPYKLQVIRKLGCPAPYVLRGYITSIRNILEHEYRRPPQMEEIRYVADIAELFLKATDEYVVEGYIRSAKVEVKGQEERYTERQKETRVVPKEIFSLECDRESDILMLVFSRAQEIVVLNRRTASVSSQEKRLSEPISQSLRLADCNKEHVVRIVRALREKCRR